MRRLVVGCGYPGERVARSWRDGERLLFAHARGRDGLVLRLAGLYGAGRLPRSAINRTYVVSDGHPTTRGEYAGLLATRLGVAPPSFEGGTGVGKRVRNARAVHELRLRLTYSSYREGLAGVNFHAPDAPLARQSAAVRARHTGTQSR